MGLLRTSSGGGQALRGLRGSRARSAGLGEVGAGFRPLCLRSLRPGHSRSRRESLQRPPTGLKRPESTLWPTPKSFSLRLSLNPLASLPTGQPHPVWVWLQPGLASLPVQLPNRKSEWVTRKPKAHAQGQLPRLLRGTRCSRRVGPAERGALPGRGAPTASRPVSPAVVSAGQEERCVPETVRA